MTTWRKEIEKVMKYHKETWKDVESSTPKNAYWMDAEFDGCHGGENGIPFTLWTEKYVYFPVTYDGEESVASAPRNPVLVPMGHVGEM